MKHNLWMVMVCAMVLLLAACMTTAPAVIEETIPSSVTMEETISSETADMLEACGRALDELWSRESYHLEELNGDDLAYLWKYGNRAAVFYVEAAQAAPTLFDPEIEDYVLWQEHLKFWVDEEIVLLEAAPDCVSFRIYDEADYEEYIYHFEENGRLTLLERMNCIDGERGFCYSLKVLDTPEEEIKAAIETAEG